jgi:small-conductance mechanosensitive channel
MFSPLKLACAALVRVAIALLCAVTPAFAQATPSPSPSVAVPGNGEEIIPFLNQTIVWYRQLTIQQQLATEPSDVLFFNDNRQTADQVVRLAFDFGRARAQALAAQPGSGTQQSGQPSPYQRLIDAAARSDQQVKASQQQVDALRIQVANASGAKKRNLQALLDETESELELFQARRDTLRNLLQFATGASGSGGAVNLLSQVEELARSTPVAAANSKETPAQGTSSQGNGAANIALAARERKEQPTGMLALIGDIMSVHRKLGALDDNLRLTDELQQSSKDLRTPLLAKVRELTQRGDALAAAQDGTQNPSVLAQQRKELEALTQEYKQLSASILPLGKQNILLDVYKRSTTNWRNAVNNEYQGEVKGLILRLGGLAVILGVVLGTFELWRKAIFRYVAEPRRRYQFLLLRRIVLWITIAVIIALSFASELGAITTFAGLLTAGIAVALQNVILSVAGYFFLVGKYGVRVGDRVQVAGVTGDVVDIGLVRLHMMEVTGGATPRPTGRIVVFSNAVVFQANAGLFKPIPGTNFLWHEVTLTLGPETDYRAAEKRLLDAVIQVFEEYREQMDVQRRSMERALNRATIRAFVPESHLHLTSTGLEVVIRYPVELDNAAEIDDRVTRALVETIEQEPRLRLLGSTIRAEEQPAEVK